MSMGLDFGTRRKYRALTLTLIEKNLTIATMESCTAGQIVSLLTDTEGSSAVVLGGFVTYSNAVKVLDGVSAGLIDKYGVYSSQTACAMAEAARSRLGSDIGVGVTGTFGNVDPNNSDSIPGEVHFAVATADGTEGFSLSVPPMGSRLEYKMYVADLVADHLLSMAL